MSVYQPTFSFFEVENNLWFSAIFSVFIFCYQTLQEVMNSLTTTHWKLIVVFTIIGGMWYAIQQAPVARTSQSAHLFASSRRADLSSSLGNTYGDQSERSESRESMQSDVVSALEFPQGSSAVMDNRTVVMKTYAARQPQRNSTYLPRKIVMSESVAVDGFSLRCVPHDQVIVPNIIDLPPKVAVLHACTDPATGEYVVCRGNDAKVAHIAGDVLWVTDLRRSSGPHRHTVMITEVDGELYAVDRANTNLHFYLCISWNPGYASRSSLRIVYNFLVQKWNARSIVDKRTSLPTLNTTFLDTPIFFVSETIATMPGHVMEYVLEALSQYYKAGLHKMGVPWVVPVGRRSHFYNISMQFAELLGFPVLEFEMGSAYHARSVYLPTFSWATDIRHENATGRFKEEVLWPAVMHRCAAEGVVPLKRIAFLKLINANNRDVMSSPSRAHSLSPAGLPLFLLHNITVFEMLPIYLRLFYVNHAELIVTSWGATITMTMMLLLQRPAHILVAVHRGYKYEVTRQLGGARLRFGVPFTLRNGISRTDLLGYDYSHPGFAMRLLWIDSLRQLRASHLTF